MGNTDYYLSFQTEMVNLVVSVIVIYFYTQTDNLKVTLYDFFGSENAFYGHLCFNRILK